MKWPQAAKLRRHARHVAQRIAPGGLILLYHRIAEPQSDPWSLCVKPRHFEEHLEVLRGRVGRLNEFPGRSSGDWRAADRIAITFDDGYADTLHTARPLLERHDAPATVFVTTGGVAHGQPFWWDELVALLEPRRDVPASLEVHHALHQRLARLDVATRDEELAELRKCASATGVETPRGLRGDEIVRLAADGLVDIGAHTVSHPKLSTLATEDQEREIHGSQQFLAALVGRPITSFAYPHGAHNPTTRRILGAAGFERACTTQFGRVRPRTDALRLPRLQVPDCDGDAFCRILRRLAFASSN